MATNKFIAVSYEDRLRNEKYRMRLAKLDKIPCDLPVEVQVEEDDRVVTKTEFREFNPHAFDNFKVSDFCLENQLSVGVTELNPNCLMRDPLSANDHLIDQLPK